MLAVEGIELYTSSTLTAGTPTNFEHNKKGEEAVSRDGKESANLSIVNEHHLVLFLDRWHIILGQKHFDVKILGATKIGQCEFHLVV